MWLFDILQFPAFGLFIDSGYIHIKVFNVLAHQYLSFNGDLNQRWYYGMDKWLYLAHLRGYDYLFVPSFNAGSTEDVTGRL